MDSLRSYLNSLSPPTQTAFAEACETTIGYLRKAMSAGDRLREKLCIAIERESGGKVRCEDLRPDVDWAYLRGSVTSSEPTPSPNPSPRPASGPGAKSGMGHAATASGDFPSAAQAPDGGLRTGAEPACLQGAV